MTMVSGTWAIRPGLTDMRENDTVCYIVINPDMAAQEVKRLLAPGNFFLRWGPRMSVRVDLIFASW